MTPASRLSGLQRDVLALYRSILRESIRKDRRASSLPSSAAPGGTESHRPRVGQIFAPVGNIPGTTTAYARDQFRREASSVKRSDFKTIEYKIRKGRKQLQLLKMPGVDFVGGR